MEPGQTAKIVLVLVCFPPSQHGFTTELCSISEKMDDIQTITQVNSCLEAASISLSLLLQETFSEQLLLNVTKFVEHKGSLVCVKSKVDCEQVSGGGGGWCLLSSIKLKACDRSVISLHPEEGVGQPVSNLLPTLTFGKLQKLHDWSTRSQRESKGSPAHGRPTANQAARNQLMSECCWLIWTQIKLPKSSEVHFKSKTFDRHIQVSIPTINVASPMDIHRCVG